jgi:predicted CoA-binding protein
MKTTLVIGASQNPERYSNKAILSLIKHGFTVVALGLKTGEINCIKILNNKPQISNIDTVTLYISPKNQICNG